VNFLIEEIIEDMQTFFLRGIHKAKDYDPQKLLGYSTYIKVGRQVMNICA